MISSSITFLLLFLTIDNDTNFILVKFRLFLDKRTTETNYIMILENNKHSSYVVCASLTHINCKYIIIYQLHITARDRQTKMYLGEKRFLKNSFFAFLYCLFLQCSINNKIPISWISFNLKSYFSFFSFEKNKHINICVRWNWSNKYNKSSYIFSEPRRSFFFLILLLVDVVVSTCVNGIFLHFHLEIILRYKYNNFKLLFVYG